jgi:hypothetical protein
MDSAMLLVQCDTVKVNQNGTGEALTGYLTILDAIFKFN